MKAHFESLPSLPVVASVLRAGYVDPYPTVEKVFQESENASINSYVQRKGFVRITDFELKEYKHQ